MAEDGKASNRAMSSCRTQETFQRAQEAQVEHRFPPHSTGIVPLPPGSRGPRSLYLRRNGDSFGFTLRHFIVYPPESIAEHDGRHAAVGALLTPMDTIFVKNVADGSSAKQAGLQRGDRIVAVNRIPVTDKSYSQVVKLIQHSPEYLHLLVVPKEEDVLQQYFSETAYNPVSNQPPKPETQEDNRSLPYLAQLYNPARRSYEIQADALSWRSLQNPHIYDNRLQIRAHSDQRGVDNPIYNSPVDARLPQEIYSEPIIHDSSQKPRAQPQVPLYRKMGRRASEGSAPSDYESSDYPSMISDPGDMVISTSKMKSVSKTAYVPEQTPQNSDMPAVNYPNSAGCRLSLEGSRRESNCSLTSSLADGSKDSLSSYDSVSTLTGHETDDSIIMSRFRKSFQKKEEFLRRPSNTTEPTLIQREFYSRPKKLEKQVWPPNDPRHESPSKATKPTPPNFQRVKNDLDSERDLVMNTQNGLVGYDNMKQPVFVTGGLVNNVPQQKGAKSPKDWGFVTNLGRIYEASPAPPSMEYIEQNGSSSLPDYADDRRYPPNFQIVSKRARQFESGRPLPEDDPMSNDRTSFYRSELARLSSKKAVPNVAVRTREFETRSSEPRRDGSSSSANSSVLKRNHRDSRSLESSESNASSGSINDLLSLRLSGNVMIPSGSKYIHCPPPSDYKEPADTSLDNRPPRMRDRSNSASSWVAIYEPSKEDDKSRNKIQRQDAVNVEKKNKDQIQQEVMDITQHPYSDLPPLIPEPVEHIHSPPALTITPSPSKTAVRPTQLDLNSLMRPARHLRPPPSPIESPTIRSVSPGNEDNNNKPVVIRRIKNTNLADEERAMRRESYLKATEGGRMHFDCDLSDGDVSPQVLRSAHRRWRPPLFPADIQQLRKLFEDPAYSLGGSISGGSSSSASLDREKDPSSPTEKDKVIKEGVLHCKITEIDGKRSADRSWKQIWAVLRGPKLFLYKDRHHQSPVGTSDIAEQSLSTGVDMRASVVRVAEDYTKRKHVLRVSSVAPCRSEFLLQAENTVDLADWVKALQEQVAANTDIESKLDSLGNIKQQAVPQTVPAQTTIQVQGSSLSLQPVPASKQQASRNRSPTGQSPVCKTRKPPSQVNDGCTSPKSKTWRGRVAKQFRKIHQGASSPSSPTAPEGSTFGVPIDHCIPSLKNQYVPRFVEICTGIVDERGLNVVGIYRVPGNNASVTALTEEVNRNYEDVPQDDPRWNDLHVVGSLLKSYFRKMPDSLVTNTLYTSFIKADKIEEPRVRLEEIKRLVKSLPPYNYHTLKHVILHLKKVVEHSEVNKMDAKNLAIVFGPTIVRAEEENMQTMVNNMNHQCKIVESLVCYAEWFFSEDDSYSANLPLPAVTLMSSEESESASNQALLLDNISKYEALKDQKEKNGALFSSIISAAQRKVKRKTKSGSSLHDSKEDTSTTANCVKDLYQQFSPTDLKQTTTVDGKSNDIPTTVIEIEKSNKPSEKVPWFNYQTDKDDFHKRVENFELETKAMLKMPRKSEIFVNSLAGPRSITTLSSSAGNVNQNTRLSTQSTPDESHLLTKTHSASNVFSRTINVHDTSRNSLDNAKDNPFTVQYANKNSNLSGDRSDFSSLHFNNKEQYLNSDSKTNGQLESANSGLLTSGGVSEMHSLDYDRFVLRRGSSVENINTNSVDLNANASLKKIKYENENLISHRAGSLDSLNKLQANLDDGPDLVTTMTKLYDEKLKKKDTNLSILTGEGLPFADESPEKTATSHFNKENIPQSPEQRYRNPLLHKSQYTSKLLKQKFEDISLKEAKREMLEKDEDSSENVPDNERHISTLNYTNKINLSNSKLKRSESLNKPERTVSPLNNKLKRSESLNKASDRLKRSDSLTKTEKTESNISKKREFATSTRRAKEVKLKRKNGMPDRSIKRRHTVGGTKDPDKVNWLDNKFQEEETSVKENCKEKNTRTSSPDLSSTRRERLFFEVNLIGPENMVVALRQHLIGARPQSFPDTSIFKVPLESHV